MMELFHHINNILYEKKLNHAAIDTENKRKNKDIWDFFLYRTESEEKSEYLPTQYGNENRQNPHIKSHWFKKDHTSHLYDNDLNKDKLKLVSIFHDYNNNNVQENIFYFEYVYGFCEKDISFVIVFTIERKENTIAFEEFAYIIEAGFVYVYITELEFNKHSIDVIIAIIESYLFEHKNTKN